MASVDGARSVTVASDERFENECGPCKYDGENKEGINYCNNCEEFLCSTCTNSHRKFKNSRNHVILPAKDVSKSMIKSEEGRRVVLCTCDQNLEISIYCEDHDDVVCKTCKTVKHRKCKTCYISEKSASFETAKLDTVEEKMRNLRMKIQTFQKDRKADMQTLEILNEDCREKIKTFRTEFEVFFDNLEQNMISELERCAAEKRHVTQSLISTCSTTDRLLESDSHLLAAAKSSGIKHQMFASTVRLSNRVQECSAIFEALQEEAEAPVLQFKENSKLNKMKEEIKDLGTVSGKSVHVRAAEDNGFVNVKISAPRQINIRLPDDEKAPWISGCDFMPNGELVICDTNNRVLKLLNSSLEVKGILQFKWDPWDVAVVNSSTCIATFIRRSKLQYIKVCPKLEAQRILNMDKDCYGIQVVGTVIFVTCHKATGEGEVRVLDMAGNVKRKLGVTEDADSPFMFVRPSFLHVSRTSGRIFVSDPALCTVICLTPGGDIVYKFDDPDLSDRRGLCADTSDSIVVCGQSSDNVHVVTADGRKHSILLSSDEGLQKPYSIAYRQSDSQLIVGCLNQDSLSAFKLTA